MRKAISSDLNSNPVNSTQFSLVVELPWVYRLVHLEKYALRDQRYRFIGTLYHDQITLTVTWISKESDSCLIGGCLVTPKWLSKLTSTAGQIIIDRLIPVFSHEMLELYEGNGLLESVRKLKSYSE